MCSATQSILLTETKELVLRIKVVTPAGDDAPVMEVQGPLNAYLPDGFSLSVDGAPLTKMTVSNCNRRGCFGALQLSDDMLTSLKRGGSLKIGFSAGPKRPRTVETPLLGFTRAMQSIQ
jgi:invasion protein IalB